MKPKIAFQLAAGLVGPDDGRRHRLVAVGVRHDGVVVTARNGKPIGQEPRHHAESRLAKKLTPRSDVYVVRINRRGDFLLARPCKRCANILRSAGAKKVFYSISDNDYGVMKL
jgi:tRNA(Arg) A34 adenosine deaminase TadA